MIVLEVSSGPHAGHKALVRSGQVLRVGRTEWADFSLPRDGAMADVHFSLRTDGQTCRLEDLGSEPGTLVNGEKVQQAIIEDGAEIAAGGTKFRVRIEATAKSAAGQGGAAAAATTTATAGPQTSGFARIATPQAAAVCKQFDLSEGAAGLLTPDASVRQFFDLLLSKSMWPDALRLLAHGMPKREGVWFAVQAVKSEPRLTASSLDKSAFDAANRWAVDPIESHREAALAAAEAARHETAAAWAAAGAAWSGGSLAPKGVADVPPPDHLTPQAVVVAVSMTVAADPPKLPQRFPQLLALGAEIADGQHRW